MRDSYDPRSRPSRLKRILYCFFSSGFSSDRDSAASHRQTHGARLYITKFKLCSSMLLKVARSRFCTKWGGTRKMRQISSTVNFRVSSSWLSCGFTEIGVKRSPSSRMATLPLFRAPPYAALQDSRRRSTSLMTPGCSSTPMGAAPLAKYRPEYSSAASPDPMALRHAAMGDSPTRPS